MNSSRENISQIKSKLESVAFMVSKGGAEKEAHAELIRAIVMLTELEMELSALGENRRSNISTGQHINEATEINKVSRRLKLWARRQSQINAKILNAYLKLEKDGVARITEHALKDALPNETSFESNFVQMKTIADRNHGKIFNQNGDLVTLWPPIEPAVREYQRIVFDVN